MLDIDSKRKIDSLRDILVGIIPNPQTQIDHITTGLIYKFIYDMDQDSISLGGKASFFSGDYQKYSWNKLFDPKLSGSDLIHLYREAVENFYLNPNVPELFRDLFKNATSPTSNPTVLRMFLKEIGDFEYSNSESLGNAFEYLLSFMGSQGDAGQFRTPRHIIDFVVEIINPQKNESILDPACGTAGFLISAYKHIHKDPLSASEKIKITENIHGYDITPEMVRLSKVNMYLHNFLNPKIHEYDTLTSEDRWQDYFDVILANPPFMTPKGGIKPHQRFEIKSNRAEILFVDYILEHLKASGRAGIIVPDGIIFQGDKSYKSLRKNLVNNGLVSVISLPAGVFKPYSGVKTSILILDKKYAKTSNSVLFAKVDNDGFELGDQRKKISNNDLPITSMIIRDFLNENFSFKENKNFCLISKTLILAEKDITLNQEKYISIEHIYENSNHKMVNLGDIVDIFSGSRDKGGALSEGIPSIGGEQIAGNGRIRTEKMKYISNEHFLKMNKGHLLKGDILLVKDGATTGKLGYFDGEYKSAAVNEHVFILRAKNGINSYFLYHLFKSQSFQNILKPYIQGIIGGINLDIKNIKLPLPTSKDQLELVKKLEQTSQKINQHLLKIDELQTEIEETINSVWIS